jgi:hypothetical protein
MTKERRKPHKPTGVSGSTKIDFSPEKILIEPQPIQFPTVKEEIEELMVQGFLNVVSKEKLIQEPINYEQNKQDDFDFTLETIEGKKALELMEIAPLEHLRGQYNQAPEQYVPYDFAKYIFNKIMKKSIRYTTSVENGLWLLVYATDFRFMLSNTVIGLLQFWTVKNPHSFERIYYHHPLAMKDGLVYTIFPTPCNYWNNFNPEDYRNNVTYIFSPLEGWNISNQ